MAKEVEIIVTAKDQASATFDKIWNSSKSFSDKIKANMNTIKIASWIAFAWLVALWKQMVTDAMFSIEQETKLTTVLKQRTNATEGQIKAIKDMTVAQQKLWIIEDDIQVAWLQQLWTFVTTTKSLEVLWPAMNNLIAQQKGFNATQGDAINIWNLMWKVLQWQTSALTRVWITFTDAQEKVLQFWTESERSAMLAQVITDNVGEMNEALAWTFQGRMTQLKNTLWDVGETIGGALIPVLQWLVEKIAPVIEKVADRISKNPELAGKIALVATWIAWLITLVTVLAPLISTVVTVVWWLATAIWLVGAVWLWPLWLIIIWIWVLIWLLTVFRWSLGETVASLGDVSEASKDANTAMDDLKIAQDNYNNAPLNTEEKQKALDALIAKTNVAINSFKELQRVSLERMKADQAITKAWKSQWEWSVAWMWQFDLWNYTRATTQIQQLQTDLSKLPKKAKWWQVFWNKPYIVWEQGQELFVPNTAWNIVPNNQLWWQTVNINLWWVIVNDQADENRLVQKISDALKRQNQLYSLGIN